MRSAAAGSGALLVLEGPPGIGKTALLTAVGTDADGFTVLHARGGDLETGFPFGVVRQLFERRLVEAGEDERRELLAGAAALAAPLLGFDEVRRWAGADVVGGVASYPRLHGLYWLAANLAAERPLLLVVDDLHWVDAPSLRWISYLASRVHELPILLLVATRPPEALPEGSALVEPIVSAPEARMIRPGPLSGAAVAAIVAEAFGTEPGRRFCAACHTATGGNPFLLRELLVDLRHAGLEPTDASAGRVGEAGPASVARSVRRRLAATDTPSIALAQTVALLGSRAEHRHVAALLGSTSGDVTTAAASLVDAGILEPDLPLRFVHPVVQAAIHAGTPAAERVDGHARAARLLAGEDAAPEEIGMHLLATPAVGDPWVVDQLRGA
ncbi:MAG TPA: AAA family ATPase, partial [Baekduia sp.]